MDKSWHSPGDSATINNSSNGGGGGGDTRSGRDQYLKQLNKLSHKISKPTIKKLTCENPVDQNHIFRPLALPPPPSASQPLVYNINKNDFRDVVQKLTGSPAHERFPTQQPIQTPKPQSTRLQRIRPPPLAHVSNRPPPMLAGAAAPLPLPIGGGAPGPVPNFNSFSRPVAPLSPLPPLPPVHAAAESPVSAYMRFLHNSASNPDQNLKQFSGLSPPAPAPGMVPPQPQFQLPFGCSNSPKSPHPLLFSPSSPRVSVSSPRRRDL